MRVHWRRIAYAALWILLLAVTLESFVHPEADHKTRAVMFVVVALLAAPISFIPLCLLAALDWLLPDTGSTIMAALFGDRILQFLVWWLIMFAISYWQWFWLAPKLLSILRPILGRWMHRGDSRTGPSETPRA